MRSWALIQNQHLCSWGWKRPTLILSDHFICFANSACSWYQILTKCEKKGGSALGWVAQAALELQGHTGISRLLQGDLELKTPRFPGVSHPHGEIFHPGPGEGPTPHPLTASQSCSLSRSSALVFCWPKSGSTIVWVWFRMNIECASKIKSLFRSSLKNWPWKNFPLLISSSITVSRIAASLEKELWARGAAVAPLSSYLGDAYFFKLRAKKAPGVNMSCKLLI